MISTLVLFAIPARSEGKNLLDWEVTRKLPWGILLLFGGGLAIAAGFQASGLAEWIGSRLTAFSNWELFLLLLMIVALVNFLTEITSNVATATILLPVLASMADTTGIHPYLLMVGATLASSCAFMLPVATPPNAVIFGSGHVNWFLPESDLNRLDRAFHLLRAAAGLGYTTLRSILKDFSRIFSAVQKFFGKMKGLFWWKVYFRIVDEI